MLKEYLNDKYFIQRYLCISFTATIALTVAAIFVTGVRLDTFFWLALVLIIPLMISDLSGILITSAVYYALFLFFYWSELAWWNLLLVLLGVLVGLYSTTFMHIATHNSIPNKYLNRFIGELCGLHQLMTFNGWAIAHLLHHKSPDDPEFDPHPPQQLTYWQYANFMKHSILRVIDNAYYTSFANDPEAKKIYRRVIIISMLNKLLRGVFWLILLGPFIFNLVYITSFITQMLFYTHFNYYTHRPDKNGKMQILNLYEGWYYRIINKMLFGIYYHKNHHLSARVLNPSTLGLIEEEYISYPVPSKDQQLGQ